MNVLISLFVALALTVIGWIVMLAGGGEAIARRVCGSGLEAFFCVLACIVGAIFVPVLVGIAGGIVTWANLSPKKQK